MLPRDLEAPRRRDPGARVPVPLVLRFGGNDAVVFVCDGDGDSGDDGRMKLVSVSVRENVSDGGDVCADSSGRRPFLWSLHHPDLGLCPHACHGHGHDHGDVGDGHRHLHDDCDVPGDWVI